MKTKTISILLLLLIGKIAYSQNYFSIGNRWTEYTVDIRDQGVENSSQYFLNKDTIIDGKKYINLVNAKDGQYISSVREENGKTYMRLIYPRTEEDILVYDFTAKEGDTIHSNCPEGDLSREMKVVKIDTVELMNGEKRKRFFFNDSNPWIEGVGNIRGFFSHAYELATDYRVQHLVCYRQDNEVLYRNNELCKENCCENIGLNANITNKTISIHTKISPNPVKNKLIIEIPEEKLIEKIEIRLTDNLGHILHNGIFNHNIYELDMSQHIIGIYYLSIKSKNIIETHKVIKL